MNKKIFLTSAVAMCVAMPAFAEPSNTGTFPANGLMQADYTYTNAATSTNMDGAYEGSVNANAQYTDNYYTVSAGTYLPADAEATATCTSGNFCPGLQSQVTYNATTAQGLETCPSEYGNSAEGASANTECFRSCAIANNGTTFTNIAHATAVSGNDYYNTTATDTCEPTACENGWHVNPGAPDLMTLIGASEAGTDYGYLSNDEEASNNTDTYGITNAGEFVVDYGNKGKIHGYARCSRRSATDPWVGTSHAYVLQSDGTTSTLPDSSGQYCYCQLDGYTPNGGTLQSLSAPWVFAGDNYDAENCAYGCVSGCAYGLQGAGANYLAFRAAAFGAVESSPAMCEANTITINWGDTDATDVTANNAGVATYGGDVRTPVKAQTKKGKTFTGWLFSKPTQQSGN